ncbi:MAG TPA: non-heme iron oxygenase ferredoxin subunit [Tepidiformaceae bacterium]|nr:non-heme iron oxygenase ferredoxin subunit [Tepidiformaceae bacterium]
MTWVEVGQAEDVAPGTVRVVEVGDERIALCNASGTLYAVDDVCSHDGGPLDQGELIGEQIECPRHGARFDIKTGRALTLPAVRPIASYPVRICDGAIEVEFE